MTPVARLCILGCSLLNRSHNHHHLLKTCRLGAGLLLLQWQRLCPDGYKEGCHLPLRHHCQEVEEVVVDDLRRLLCKLRIDLAGVY